MTVERFSGAGWTLADQAIVSGSNFLTIYLLARCMEIGEFGLYMAGWIMLLFLVSLQSAMITEPHNVLGPRREGEQYRLLTAVLSVVLIVASLTLALILVGVGRLTSALGVGAYGTLLTMLGVIAVPWMAQEYVRRVLYTRSQSRAACANDAVSYGLQVTGTVILIAITARPSFTAALAVLGGSSLLAACLGAWQLRHHVAIRGLRLEAAGKTWAEAADFGKWLLARNLVSWCGQYGHAWLLLAMLGPAALGTYKAAEHLLNLVNPLRLAACSYLPPRGARVFAEDGLGALLSWVRGVYRAVGIPLAGCLLLLMVFAKPLLDLAYGDRFGDQRLEWIIVLAGIAALITFARVPLEMGINATKQSRSLFWVSLWSVPVLIVSGTVLIHLFGIFGVPISAIIISGVLLAQTQRALRRITVAGILTEPPTSVPAGMDPIAVHAPDAVLVLGPRGSGLFRRRR